MGYSDVSKANIWDDRNYVQAYLYARDGLSNSAIANAIGVTPHTFIKWIKAKTALKDALEIARVTECGDANNIVNYVYRGVPAYLKPIYAELAPKKWDTEESMAGIGRIETLLENHGKHARQALFLHLLVACGFNVSSACRRMNMSITAFQDWKKDSEFATLVNEMDFHLDNLYESALISQVVRGNIHAIIFANRTRNKDRGYSERIDINHQHEVNHKHSFSIEDLDLSEETLLDIQRAMRLKRGVQQEVIDVEVKSDSHDGTMKNGTQKRLGEGKK